MHVNQFETGHSLAISKPKSLFSESRTIYTTINTTDEIRNV